MNAIGEKISIIVPIYNMEVYLPKCIESILTQSYSNTQIILIDDGSTDNSGNICDTYARQDSRIEVYHTKNHGLVLARKLGLKVSTGQYIGFVDADDYIEPTMFSDLIDNIKENDADFVHFGFIEENIDASIPICNSNNAVFEMKDKYDQINFLCNYVIKQQDISPSIWSKLFKADFIKRCYKDIPDNQQYGEDMICLCYCILKANRISLSKKTPYHYVIRENSLSHSNNEKKMINEVKLWNCILNILEQYKCENIVKESVCCFLKKRIFYFARHISENNLYLPRYYFENLKTLCDKNVIIYGAGSVGQDYYTQICRFNKCKIVAWVDQQWYKYNFKYFEIVGIEKVKDIKFDVILIAILNDQVREEIKNTLLCDGYPEIKICWQKPGVLY